MESYHVSNETLNSKEIAWSAAYAVMGFMVVVINTSTLWIFIKTAPLRTRKHVMVINLVVADLLFGAVGLPCSVVYMLKQSIISYPTYQAVNTFFKTVSLFTLGVIAVERMHAIVWPLRHRVLNNRVYKIALAVIWVLSAVVTTATTFYEIGLLKMTLLYDLLVPLVIITVTIIIMVCYVSIWIAVRRRKHHKLGNAHKQDKALAVTLLLVAGAFLVCWGIPLLYFCISRLKICQNCLQPSIKVLRSARLIFAVQSMINPIIYCLRLPEFKASLKVRIQDLKCSENFSSRRRCPRESKTSDDTEMVNFSTTDV